MELLFIEMRRGKEKTLLADAECLFPPRKRYLYYVNYCVSIYKFLNDIFGGQTGDKISHIKRKKNNKTTSQKPC